MRPIDADTAMDRYYGEWEKQGIWDGDQDRDWLMRCIEEAPTLTLPEELDQLKRERDAAVADLNELRKRTERECACCYYLDNYDRDICCGCEHSNYNLWEWRGIQKEER